MYKFKATARAINFMTKISLITKLSLMTRPANTGRPWLWR